MIRLRCEAELRQDDSSEVSEVRPESDPVSSLMRKRITEGSGCMKTPPMSYFFKREEGDSEGNK